MFRLEELRKNRGYSQEQLANLLKMTQQRISSYEKGKREPDLETLKQIADFFGVTTDYLLGKETELDNISVAFSSITEGLSKEQVEDVKRYIEFLKSKEK